MSLQQWLANGWLHAHQATRGEIAERLAHAEEDLRGCRIAELSADWRLAMAYNAALQVAAAALAAEGFRTRGGTPHHHYTIQSLSLTAGIDAARVRLLDDIRRKRNAAEYDRLGSVSDAEARAAVEFATRLREDVIRWLRDKHPMLLSK